MIEYKKFPVKKILVVTILFVSGIFGVRGQTKSYLDGDKTGNFFGGGAALSLGPGTAGISTPPLSSHSTLNPLGAGSKFRFYYGNSSILSESSTIGAKLKATQDLGVLGLLGAGSDVYLQIRNRGNGIIPSGKTTYVKLKERPTLTGASIAVGSLLGLVELQSIQGKGFSNSSGYVLNTASTSTGVAYNGDEKVGSAVPSLTKILIDKNAEWYAAITPNGSYNSVRLEVSLPADLRVADIARVLEVNVYNAFTQSDGNICSTLPQFTSPGEATGINLATGALGLNLNSLVKDPEKAINDSKTDYSVITAGVANVGVASTISQTFYFDHMASGTDGVTLKLGLTQALVDLNLLGNGVKFTLYNNDALVGSTQTLSDNLVGLNLLNLITIDGQYKQADLTIKPTNAGSFNKIVVSYNTGLVNADVIGDGLRIYDVNLTSAKPTFTAPASNKVQICSGQTAGLKATTDANSELLWYNSLTATNVLAVRNSNTQYDTTVLTNNTNSPITTTFYVASKKKACQVESGRVPVVVTIFPLPGHPQTHITSN